jgi:hypothetical protein
MQTAGDLRLPKICTEKMRIVHQILSNETMKAQLHDFFFERATRSRLL